MKFKKSAVALAVALLVSSNGMPAMADDESLEKATEASLVVTRVGGMGLGIVLGTPIAIIKRSYRNYVDYTTRAADKVGEPMGGSENGPVCLACSLVTLPAGLLVGSLEGIYYGSKNGMVSGFNKPFHSDSFSLGELEGE